MPGLWRNEDGTPEGKYLVLRRDGTKPEWPYFVIGAADPAAPIALMAYAGAAMRCGMDLMYIKDLIELARQFEEYAFDHPEGDPDAPRHREDDPEIIRKMNE